MEQTAGHTHVLLVTYVEFPSLRVPGMNYVKKDKQVYKWKSNNRGKKCNKGKFLQQTFSETSPFHFISH